jgi:hypothetical protein
MSSPFERKAGLALIIFTLLVLFTMILHPAGGNFQQLLRLAPMILVSHSLAILSVPFGAVGFWGLTKRLGTENFLSITAFSMAALALVGTLLAATTSGLILPIFIFHYKDASPDIVDSLNPVLTYSRSVNTAFDYIYTGAFCLAILGWSIAGLNTKSLPRGLAIWGLVVAAAGLILAIVGPSPATLHGLYLFAACLISWIIMAAAGLIRKYDA